MLKEVQIVTAEGEEVEEVTIENPTTVNEVAEESVPEKEDLPHNNGKIKDEDENDEEEEEGEGEATVGEKTVESKIIQQTEPPSIPVSKFFPDAKYPEGEICEYKNEMTNEEKRYLDRMRYDDYNDLRRAAEVHRQVRKYAQKVIKPGMTMIEICEMIENGTRTLVEENGLEAGIGFPTGCSLNNCAAHYTPNSGDPTVLQYDDVCKIDFGTHVNGRIVDCAFTLTFNPVYDPLKAAVKDATNTGVREAGIDVRLNDIGAAIQEALKTFINIYEVKPIRNLNGHSILPYQIHAGKSVPIVKGSATGIKMEASTKSLRGLSYIKVKGYVREDGECSHYAKRHDVDQVTLRIKKAKSLLNNITKHFGTLPFCRRYLDRVGETKYALALKHLVDSNVVESYPPLVDIKESESDNFRNNRINIVPFDPRIEG
ncbi:10661_t:CDS:10 [Cetraspora pellucida]|uniref:10661_t:CDS:1 n=1 Tax=Cetraspora pellucida TaxID=1433469 RepID=A0ACA9KCL5_9GLOM|nr:10661_t:CDS:10 [Cetraspora pellucida]